MCFRYQHVTVKCQIVDDLRINTKGWMCVCPQPWKVINPCPGLFQTSLSPSYSVQLSWPNKEPVHSFPWFSYRTQCKATKAATSQVLLAKTTTARGISLDPWSSWFQNVTSTSMQTTVFWEVAPYSLVHTDRRLRGASSNRPHTEAVSTSETSVKTYQTIRRNIQKTAVFITSFPYAFGPKMPFFLNSGW
jgi:hypothetical protein